MDLKELSKITNFSVSTISKAFNNAEDVSEETKKLIFDAAKKHGCFGKYYKGRYNKKIIAIICPEFRGGFYTEYVECLKRIIEDDNGMVVISADDFRKEKQAELIEYYASYLRVDGILVFSLGCDIKRGYDTPVVGIMSSMENTDTVTVDWSVSMNEVVESLKELGHTRIGYAGEKLTKKKKEYFYNAAKKAGLVALCAIESDKRLEEAGKDAARQIICLDEPPTAVICAYDTLAVGFIKELNDNGYSVPEDFSVVGMDNISTAGYMNKALSTIGANPDEVCRIAWELLSKKMDNEYYSLKQKIVISSRFIKRDTTAPPREKG